MSQTKSKLVERKYLVTFILVTSLFSLWGFANDFTNPMVAAFRTVMELSNFKASMIQFAFYGGYATMAIPAALFIRKYSYKSGILVGLALYAAGAILAMPAAQVQSFVFFCLALYILTFGLAFLETTANPFILALGSKETSTRRLNMAQAFNPVGSLTGMAVASFLVLPNLLSDERDAAGQLTFAAKSAAEKASICTHDLAAIRTPYVVIGLIVLAVFVVFLLKKMPKTESEQQKEEGQVHSVKTTLRNLWNNSNYRFGVFSQFCYVGAQIMCWTFIIQYAERLGLSWAEAQMFNIVAMSLNLVGRFVGTYLMKYFNSRLMLAAFAIGAMICTMGAILIDGMMGLYSLVLISLFMSIMFPSIYGIALENVETSDTTLGAAFLVMAILGGAVFPPMQGAIIDYGTIMNHPAVNVSYVLPLLCFLLIMIYGFRAYRNRQAMLAAESEE
ncbi:MAG: L-fucose:H+ symporter permease [Prevotella sp.]|nr:L-fucose:H+ symporter permease [Prevotella sp.]